MAYAFGGHAAFGLGFLNFLGTLLFIVFLVFVFKMLFRGMRYAGAQEGWSMCSWQGPGRGRQHVDEAMETARERLAQSDISPEEFETLKSGLRGSAPQEPGYRHDSALATARMRFAQGEISQEEFEAVKKALLA